MRVRAMTAADAEAVMALHVAAIREFGPEAYDDRQVEAWATAPDGAEPYREGLGESDVEQFVAESDGQVVGWGRLELGDGTEDADDGEDGDADDPDDGDDVGEVTAVYVDPDHAREGVGTALLSRLEGRARRRGVARLVLSASLNAVGFYERQGYERVERRPHETTEGVALPVVVMEKTLDGGAEPGGDGRKLPDAE